ncbi:MAG TPA: tRNA guanosine(34) transglycosylase Tgt [Acidimicrobiales bacterium]|nr:tRNA guanosine(34) transglycosylase Tgt [Acidimicrobiales bacterium]
MTAARMEVTATEGLARTGVVHTARGSYPVPTFMPVGTRGSVKALDSPDLEAVGADVVLANTYHLMLRPGAAVVAALGGLHRFTGWTGHTLTDSGGYQVHSLSPAVDDDGVSFTSVYDGLRARLTPEMAVEAQGLIGADIQMVLDVCASLPATPEVLRLAVDRTSAWAARGRLHHRRLEARPEGQALFGIVQGGTDHGLRVESARRTVELDFDGYGIGGLSVGEPKPEMLETLAVTLPELPADRVRYLMGIGDPVGMIEAIGLGVDQFDCVAPTRMARHGSMLTAEGRLNLRNAVHTRDDGPLDPNCGCSTCSRWSRGYLRHLLSVGEPTAWRLLSIHNLAYMVDLMAQARTAIATGRFSQLQASVTDVWGPGGAV